MKERDEAKKKCNDMSIILNEMIINRNETLKQLNEMTKKSKQRNEANHATIKHLTTIYDKGARRDVEAAQFADDDKLNLTPHLHTAVEMPDRAFRRFVFEEHQIHNDHLDPPALISTF